MSKLEIRGKMKCRNLKSCLNLKCPNLKSGLNCNFPFLLLSLLLPQTQGFFFFFWFCFPSADHLAGEGGRFRRRRSSSGGRRGRRCHAWQPVAGHACHRTSERVRERASEGERSGNHQALPRSPGGCRRSATLKTPRRERSGREREREIGERETGRERKNKGNRERVGLGTLFI